MGAMMTPAKEFRCLRRTLKSALERLEDAKGAHDWTALSDIEVDLELALQHTRNLMAVAPVVT